MKILKIFLLISICNISYGQSDILNVKIKKDLLDKKVCIENTNCWTFNALTEFKEFKVEEKKQLSDIIEKIVKIKLESIIDHKRYQMRLFVRYKYSKKYHTYKLVKWQLLNLTNL